MGDFESSYFPSPASSTDDEVDFEYDMLPSPVKFTNEEESSDVVSNRRDLSGNHELAKLSESMLRTDQTSASVEHTDTEEALDEKIWGSLPDELLLKILTWLPPVTLLRFRCVCVHWKSLFSSPEWLQLYAQVKHRSSTIMCTIWEAHFFCHMEQKWFQIPLSFNCSAENQWELVDSDAGLLLYNGQSCYITGGLEKFCLCNPLTGSSKVLLPYQVDKDFDTHFLKLLVDRRTQHFKVVVLVAARNWWEQIIVHDSSTIVYDSSTSVWSVYNTFPSHPLGDEIFVWKNVIYAQSAHNSRLHMTFDIDSGIWSEVEIELPGHLNPSDSNIQVSRYSSEFDKCIRIVDRSWQRPRHFFVNSNGKLLLIRLGSWVEEPIAAWELLSDALKCTTAASKSHWKKIKISLPENLRTMLRGVTHCFWQSDCVVLSTSHSNKWFTYSFVTKSWRVMPARVIPARGRSLSYSWLEWESRLDIEIESDPLYESHWPGLLSSARTTHALISKAGSKDCR